MRFAVFFAFLLVLFTALNVFVHRRASDLFALTRRGRRALAVVFFVGVLTIPAGRLLGAVLPEGLLMWVALVGLTLELAVLISAAFLFVIDVPRFFAKHTGRLIGKSRGQAPEPK